jgi:hypothetical protein
MIRTDEQYFADIRAVLHKFYQPGDKLSLVRFFTEPRKCQMGGKKVDIWNCYELRNERSGERIICGCNCIIKYATVLRLIDQTPVIFFPERFRDHADKINRRLPNTVVIQPLREVDKDLERDLCECGVELTYCEECDNKMCPECERGCTCSHNGNEDAEYWDEESADEGGPC